LQSQPHWVQAESRILLPIGRIWQQYSARCEEARRLATLVVFAREMETVLTDAAVAMFDKLIGLTFRKANRLHEERTVSQAKTLNASARMFVTFGKAVIAAHAANADVVKAIDQVMGWERFIAAVTETESIIADTHEDALTEVVERYPTIRKAVLPFLQVFTFRSWQADDPILVALDILRTMYTQGQRFLPDRVPLAFLNKPWRQFLRQASAMDRQTYEIATIVHLRDRLRAGDIWVDGSRAFRAFDDFLLPPKVFDDMQRERKLDGNSLAWRVGVGRYGCAFRVA
jgi:hypothetical protein